MRKFTVLLMGLFLSTSVLANVHVPERMKFCGMDITLNAAARKYISNVIAKMKPGSSYHQALVTKADIYFPFVEEAFAQGQAPDDLKYIVLQESALRGDAVSSSNAVGYWQFKEPAAREVGLVINSKIDERKHIFRASLGAARYFYRINRDFDNWIYAIIGYNRGPFGAIPYTNEKNYGKRKMTITENTHWYALKAIAHKLAFQDYIGKSPAGTWVEAKSTKGETSVARLAKLNGVDLATFKKENPWIKGSALPTGENFTYYVAHKGTAIASRMQHAKDDLKPKQVGSAQPKAQPKPPAKVATTKRIRGFSYADAHKDPAYGQDYVQARPGQKLVEIAVARKKNIKRLRKYNRFGLEHRVQAGDIIYLKPPHSVRFHIVKKGETLRDIAKLHETSVDKLRQKNRMRGTKVYPGQRLYLKSRRPKKQKPIIIANPWASEGSASASAGQSATSPKPKSRPKAPAAKLKTTSKKQVKAPRTRSNITIHVVQPGETLWRISKRYGTTVEAVRKLNRMKNNNLYVGQKVKVMRKAAR